ncbi:SEC7-like guanine nucleotide exchange family protein [Medicago truncatula]|nr:SEC7-like guanine nucleotide exchange family protein [Medicago truncatula]
MEADSWTILIQPIVVVELMDQVEKSDVDSSMPENVDMQSMRGKMVLELLKILLENVGAVFRTSER